MLGDEPEAAVLTAPHECPSGPLVTVAFEYIHEVAQQPAVPQFVAHHVERDPYRSDGCPPAPPLRDLPTPNGGNTYSALRDDLRICVRWFDPTRGHLHV